MSEAQPQRLPQPAQQTGIVTAVSIYHTHTQQTSLNVPTVDAQGRWYVREFVIDGRVIDMGWDWGTA